MVAYYGMSDKLKNVSFYDSTGRYDYGFTKPYSEKTAELIDEETSAIIAAQMERAKQILQEHAEGHNRIAQLLIEHEVITSEDVAAILGPRPWKSREDEIIEANEAMQEAEKKAQEGSAKQEQPAEETTATENLIPSNSMELTEDDAHGSTSDNQEDTEKMTK